MSTEIDHKAAFREMCNRHDLTYEYSDDGGVWRRGNESLARIRAYAKAHLSGEDAKTIWNEIVDGKIVEGHRTPFYW